MIISCFSRLKFVPVFENKFAVTIAQSFLADDESGFSQRLTTTRTNSWKLFLKIKDQVTIFSVVNISVQNLVSLKVAATIFQCSANRISFKNCFFAFFEKCFFASKKLFSFSGYSNVYIFIFLSFLRCRQLQEELIKD